MKQFLIAVSVFVSAWSSASAGYRSLHIVPRFTGVDNKFVVTLAETRNTSGKVLAVQLIAHDGDTIVPGPSKSVTKVWWVCKPYFDSSGIGAFNPDLAGNPPKIDLRTSTQVLAIPAKFPASDTSISDTSSIAWELWDYKLVYSDSLRLTNIARFYRTASVMSAVPAAGLPVQFAGSVVRLDLDHPSRIDLLTISGKTMAVRQVAQAGRVDLDMGIKPEAGDLLVVRTLGQAPRFRTVLPSH